VVNSKSNSLGGPPVPLLVGCSVLGMADGTGATHGCVEGANYGCVVDSVVGKRSGQASCVKRADPIVGLEHVRGAKSQRKNNSYVQQEQLLVIVNTSEAPFPSNVDV
jgi:hypothetical protein